MLWDYALKLVWLIDDYYFYPILLSSDGQFARAENDSIDGLSVELDSIRYSQLAYIFSAGR